MNEHKQNTFKAIRVTPDVQNKMAMVTKLVMVQTNGEVATINGALEFILDEVIKNGKV